MEGFGDLNKLDIDTLSHILAFLPHTTHIEAVSISFHTLTHCVPGIIRDEIELSCNSLLVNIALQIPHCKPLDLNESQEILYNLFLKKPMKNYIIISKQLQLSIKFLDNIIQSMLIQITMFLDKYNNKNNMSLLYSNYNKFIIEWSTRFNIISSEYYFIKLLLNKLEDKSILVIKQLDKANEVINEININDNDNNLNGNFSLLQRMCAIVSDSWDLYQESINIMNNFRKDVKLFNSHRRIFQVFTEEFKCEKNKILNGKQLCNIKEFILNIKDNVDLLPTKL